jgi:hypothetical protein
MPPKLCCCGCSGLKCSAHFKKIKVTIGGLNDFEIEHQMMGADNAYSARAATHKVTLTVTGTPLAGDQIRFDGITWVTILAADITAGTWRQKILDTLNSGPRLKLRWTNLPFATPEKRFVDNGTDMIVNTLTTDYPAFNPASATVISPLSSTLSVNLTVQSLLFTAPFYYDLYPVTKTYLYFGFGFIGQRDFKFDYGSASVTGTIIGLTGTYAEQLAERDLLIADLIDQITTNKLIDDSITIVQDGDWIVFTRPVDVMLGIKPPTEMAIIGPNSWEPRTDTESDIKSIRLRKDIDKETCCTPERRSGQFVAIPPSPVPPDFPTDLGQGKWSKVFEQEETFGPFTLEDGLYGSSIIIPNPCGPFGQPCTLDPPITGTLNYQATVTFTVNDIRVTICFEEVYGVKVMKVTLVIQHTWSWIISTLASFQTVPTVQTGFINESHTREFYLPVTCPVPDSFEDAGEYLPNPYVQDNISVGVSDAECCSASSPTYAATRYQPLRYAPITLNFLPD